jgi:hypothetical protein
MDNLNHLFSSNLKIPHVVYHYCSTESFLNIIKSSSLYLSSTKYMNDYLESKWLKHTLEIVEKKYKRGSLDKIHISTIKNIIPHFRESIYVACFSKHKDMLSQWRGFASNGSGMAIGFNTKVLSFLNVEHLHNFSNLSIGEVLYEPKKQEEFIFSVINYYIKKINIEHEHKKSSGNVYPLYERVTISDVMNGKIDYNDSLNLHISKCCQILIFLSFLLKNNKFSEESEYRICYYPDFSFLNKKNIGDAEKIVSPYSFRVSDDRIIPYYSLNFPSYKDVVKNVILGPKCQTDIKTIRNMLEHFGYQETKVEKSEASYR